LSWRRVPIVRLPAALAAVALAVPGSLAPRSVEAQAAGLALAPKRSLSLPAVSACLREPAPAVAARRDEGAARTTAARARELALVGDRAGARAAFARALALDPSAAPVAYDLARAAEEAGDARGARGAYCHFLALAPAGADAADARARVARLSGGAAGDADRRARDSFARGLAALDARRFAAAELAFTEVLRATPTPPRPCTTAGWPCSPRAATPTRRATSRPTSRRPPRAPTAPRCCAPSTSSAGRCGTPAPRSAAA
jgi:tetratricopeptide (TPR) repeat protein